MNLRIFVLVGAVGSLVACGSSVDPESNADEAATSQDELRGSNGSFCGGIANIQCPAGMTCVDKPGDGCDPAKGGADCGGICVPASPAPPSSSSTPTPDAPPSSSSTPTPDAPPSSPSTPTPDAPPSSPSKPSGPKGGPLGQTCGGFIGKPCPAGETCVYGTVDDCDPAKGDADCLGVCRKL